VIYLPRPASRLPHEGDLAGRRGPTIKIKKTFSDFS
jgi:hypothetical protein